MKIAIITDTHWGVRNDNVAFLDNSKQFLDNIFFPTIEKMGLTSITEIFDHSKCYEDITKLSIHQYGQEWVDHVGAWYSPHHWVWQDIEKYVVPQNMDNKRVGIIFGRDKPGVFQNRDHIQGFSFRDTSVNSYLHTPVNENVDVINFYWDPTFTQILVKQLHVLLKAGKVMNVDPTLFEHVHINELIYDLKKKLVFKSGKSATGLFSLRDMYLIDKTNSDIFKFYASGISNMKSRIDIHSIKPFYSRFYSIE